MTHTTLYLLSMGATACIVVGLGWGVLTGDWLMGGVLFVIGLVNAVRFRQMYKAQRG